MPTTRHWPSDSAGRDMPIYDTKPAPSVTVSLADGWLVTLTCGGGYFQHAYSDEWCHALDTYKEPPRGYQAVAISACIGGVPFCKLSAVEIGQLRASS